VHAAGLYEDSNKECCSDYIVSSYIPTLAALIHARSGRSVFLPQQIRLITVASEKTRHSNMPLLHHALQETRSVVNIAASAGISSSFDAGNSSKLDVLAHPQSSQIVHLACHGVQDRQESHESYFCLSSSNLTIRELMNMETKGAFLAYLSACETAMGDSDYADEAIHLAASMLFAGFKNVVATIW
jgi:CHAT domain-containing protein